MRGKATRTILPYTAYKRIVFQNTFDVSESPLTSIACRNTNLEITCPSGQLIILASADFGRGDNTTCFQTGSSSASTNCHSDVLSKIAPDCNGKNACIFNVYNSELGNPCSGTREYLNVSFVCASKFLNDK